MNFKPVILGHRGASAVAPENTLAAFSRAMHDGANGIEFDVRLSRDLVPVVIHDANLKRTGLVDRLVGELTVEELQRIDVGCWFGRGSQKRGNSPGPYSGEFVPTLKQVFELFRASGSLLYIEMKQAPRDGVALATEVVRLIRDADLIDRVVVESFDLSAVAEVKNIDENIRTAALFEPKLSHPISSLRPLSLIDLARASGADEIALHYTLANPRLIEKAIAQGFDVVVWTVDDPKWIRRARTLGIKALIANNPAVMIQSKNDQA